MPYATNSDLPAPVRHHLPPTARTIYREAFNNAWDQYAKSGRREEIAHRVAWAAVKKRFRKGNGSWVPVDQPAAASDPAKRAQSARRRVPKTP
jgi:cation transport regulator